MKKKMFDANIHDFGNTKKNKVLKCSFKIMNQTNKNFSIEKIEVECNCVEVSISKKYIKIGDIAFLNVLLNTLDYNGKISKNIYVLTNSKPKLTILKVIANVD